MLPKGNFLIKALKHLKLKGIDNLKEIKHMQTIDLMKEIIKLPLNKRFYILEETIKSIKKEEIQNQMEFGVNELYEDYVNDKELTAFTAIDFENFYETK